MKEQILNVIKNRIENIDCQKRDAIRKSQDQKLSAGIYEQCKFEVMDILDYVENYKGELQTLQDDVSEWSNATFGPGQRTDGMIAHLAREVQELKESPTTLSEYADCLMLLIDAAGSVGFNMDDLVKATFEKLEINKKRKWGPANEDGSIEHVEEK